MSPPQNTNVIPGPEIQLIWNRRRKRHAALLLFSLNRYVALILNLAGFAYEMTPGLDDTVRPGLIIFVYPL